MATFTLTIDCDNAAFEADPNAEVARILGDLSGFIGRKVCFLTDHPEIGSLRDVNGNGVGSWQYQPAGDYDGIIERSRDPRLPEL
jgi:hypothetical protein